MQALHDEHRISIWYAGEVVSSLKRAGELIVSAVLSIFRFRMVNHD
jgi:hypothetical protein